MNRSGALALLMTATAVLGSECGLGPATQAPPTPLPVVADLSGITAEGRLEPARHVELAPLVDGLVSEVLVVEGEQVQAGQLLLRLDNVSAETLETARTDAATELADAYQSLRVAQDDLDSYPLPRIFVGLTAEQAARTWLAELDAAYDVFEPFRDTSRKTLKSRDAFSFWVYPSLPHRVLYDTREYDGVALEYKKRVDVALTNYTKAVLWLQRQSAVTSATARVTDAQRRYDSLYETGAVEGAAGARAALATAEIRAPFSGTITEIAAKVGELASAGTSVLTLADVSSWLVQTTDLTEIDVINVETGMPVIVTLDSMPGISFRGTVRFVDLGYTDRQGDILYTASIRLTETHADMRWGMTAEVSFET